MGIVARMTLLTGLTRQHQARRHQLAVAGGILRCSVRHQASHNSQSNDVVNGSYDLIGPPRPVSNLRPVKFSKNPSESDLAIRLRELRQETQKFNEEWWVKHNKEFMNKQWSNHLEYNKEWQKRNWSIIGLMARLKL